MEYPKRTQPTVPGSSANKPARYWPLKSRRVSKKINVGPNHRPTIAFMHTHAGARRRTELSLSIRFNPCFALPAFLEPIAPDANSAELIKYTHAAPVKAFWRNNCQNFVARGLPSA